MANPWDDAPDLWKSEKHFCQWLRSQSRRIWSRHPIKNRYKKSRTVSAAYLDGFKEQYPKARTAIKCEMCNDWRPSSHIEVDHIEPAGSFGTVQEWFGWLGRLLVLGFQDIRLLCKPCHLKVTLAEKFGCDVSDVWAYQEVAAFNKLKVKEARKVMEKHGLPSDIPLSKMKVIFKKHMMEKIYVDID